MHLHYAVRAKKHAQKNKSQSVGIPNFLDTLLKMTQANIIIAETNKYVAKSTPSQKITYLY